MSSPSNRNTPPKRAPHRRTPLARIPSKNRLYLGLRHADDAQDVTGRGLCVECSGQIPVACLQLPEQPHILNGDDRLVGEGLEEGDLLGSEGVDIRAPEPDSPERLSLAQQRNVRDRPQAGNTSADACFWELFCLGLNIGYLHGPAL